MTTVLIAVAGAAGAVTRYRIGLAVGVRDFPWATLMINVSGCFLLAMVLGASEGRWSADVTAAVSVGFLGAYTTFSTFGYETFTLLRTDRIATAGVYVAASVLSGLVATVAGYAAGRAIA